MEKIDIKIETVGYSRERETSKGMIERILRKKAERGREIAHLNREIPLPKIRAHQGTSCGSHLFRDRKRKNSERGRKKKKKSLFIVTVMIIGLMYGQ